MSRKELVGELGLVLELDPVPCLLVSHCMLQEHDFEHFYGLGENEFTLGDEGTDRGRQGHEYTHQGVSRCQRVAHPGSARNAPQTLL